MRPCCRSASIVSDQRGTAAVAGAQTPVSETTREERVNRPTRLARPGYDSIMSQTGRLVAGLAALVLAPLAFLAFQPQPPEPQPHGCMDAVAFSFSGDSFSFDITPYVVMGVLALIGIGFIVSCPFVQPAEAAE